MAWAQIETRVEIDPSDIEFADDSELEEFVESKYNELGTDTVIEYAMNYCNPTRFVKLMFEKMSIEQCLTVIEDLFLNEKDLKLLFFKRHGKSNLNGQDLLAKYLQQVNPNWKNEFPLNLSTIAFFIERIIRSTEYTTKPAETKE